MTTIIAAEGEKITVQMAADRFGIPPRTIYNAIQDERLPIFCKIKGRFYLDPITVRDWVEKKQGYPAGYITVSQASRLIGMSGQAIRYMARSGIVEAMQDKSLSRAGKMKYNWLVLKESIEAVKKKNDERIPMIEDSRPLPERRPDCVSYAACLDKAAYRNKIFRCDKCDKYESRSAHEWARMEAVG